MIRASLITGPFTITAHVSVGKSDDGFGLAVKLDGKFPELAA